jgi:hypothetical protein
MARPDNVRDIPDGNALVDEERVKDIELVSAVLGVNGERGVGGALLRGEVGGDKEEGGGGGV